MGQLNCRQSDGSAMLAVVLGRARTVGLHGKVFSFHPLLQYSDLKVRTKDQYRIVYTEYQRIELEREFAANQFINSQRKAELSLELQLTER